MTSASPYWIILAESPIEWVPVEHAVVTAMLGPRIPFIIESCPAAMLMMVDGTKNGLMCLGPFSMSLVWFISI